MTPHDARMLHVDTRGTGPSLTFLHGFTQTSRSWDHIVDDLQHEYTCHSVDLPGHGATPDARRSLVDIAHDVSAAVPPGTLVGYSFGARVALHVAVLHPRHVSRLVLVSGTAGIIDDQERAQRRASDDALARRIETIGVNQFVDEWLALPLFSGLNPDTDQRADRCTNTASGLADSLRYAGTGLQQPLWGDLGDVSCDVLLIAGENDTKFVDLARRMHDALPHSEIATVEGAGHTVHLEAPDSFLAILRRWLSTHPC